jgi:hypothetical protein
MDGFQKPRHIRDIAHLYISRRAVPDDERRKRIYVAAASRECFGAYHAVNLALGFAQKGHDVELLETSAVLPCSGYFLRLPPRVYIKHKKQFQNDALSALGGVRIRFGAASSRARDVIAPDASSRVADEDEPTPGISVGPRRRSKGIVEVYNLPPVNDLESIEAVLREAEDAEGDREPRNSRAIVIADNNPAALEAGRRVFGGRPTIDWATLSLGGQRRSRSGARNGRRSLGYISGWRPLLSDPLPCVVRDPGSHVSRSYLTVCDELLSTGRVAKGRNDGKTFRRTASVGRFR